MKNEYLSLNAQLTSKSTQLPLAAPDHARLNASHSTYENRTQPQFSLTAREREVLALLCAGLPNKVISRELGIDGGTVKCHLTSIFRELGVACRLQALVWASRYGLLDEDDANTRAAGASPANDS